MKHCPELKDSCVPKGGQTEGGARDRMMRGRRGEKSAIKAEGMQKWTDAVWSSVCLLNT